MEATVSASTQVAPPCSSPYGWVFPATGIVPTTRPADASVISIPMVRSRPGGRTSGRVSVGVVISPPRQYSTSRAVLSAVHTRLAPDGERDERGYEGRRDHRWGGEYGDLGGGVRLGRRPGQRGTPPAAHAFRRAL